VNVKPSASAAASSASSWPAIAALTVMPRTATRSRRSDPLADIAVHSSAAFGQLAVSSGLSSRPTTSPRSLMSTGVGERAPTRSMVVNWRSRQRNPWVSSRSST
jgi:hypothetical protein